MSASKYILAAIGIAGLLATAIPAKASMDIDYKEIARREATQTSTPTNPVQTTTIVYQASSVNS